MLCVHTLHGRIVAAVGKFVQHLSNLAKLGAQQGRRRHRKLADGGDAESPEFFLCCASYIEERARR